MGDVGGAGAPASAVRGRRAGVENSGDADTHVLSGERGGACRGGASITAPFPVRVDAAVDEVALLSVRPDLTSDTQANIAHSHSRTPPLRRPW